MAYVPQPFARCSRAQLTRVLAFLHFCACNNQILTILVSKIGFLGSRNPMAHVPKPFARCSQRFGDIRFHARVRHMFSLVNQFDGLHLILVPSRRSNSFIRITYPKSANTFISITYPKSKFTKKIKVRISSEYLIRQKKDKKKTPAILLCCVGVVPILIYFFPRAF